MNRDIWVIVEQQGDVPTEGTFEALAAARAAGADDEAPPRIVAVATQAPGAREAVAAASRASDRALLVRHGDTSLASPDIAVAALALGIDREHPALVLLPHTARGIEVGPALAERIGAPAITDCLSLAMKGGALAAERRPYSGKVVEQLGLAPTPTVVATIRPGGRQAPAPDGPTLTIDELELESLPAGRGRVFLETVAAVLDDVDITAAEVLVAIGRGIGGPENLPLVQTFADAIGATVCCSRPVIDAGWLPKSRQVGSSGRSVRPRIYMAFGISGAYQHVTGIRGAGTIIAVNTDPSAPIFEVAQHAVVADAVEVLEALNERLGQ